MTYELMTVALFLQSYDRDVLDLHDNPASYINEVETQLAQKHSASMGKDLEGNLVWPVGVMKAHLDIQGEPQWPRVSLRL